MLLYIVSALSGMIGALAVWKWGRAVDLIDIPNKRSSHTKPVPKGGGIGILAAFILVSLWLGISPWFWVPLAFLALISLAGDRISLSPAFRLFVQFAAAAIVVLGGEPGAMLPGAGFFLTVVVTAFILVFIVGTANIYNFMDGIDGIAAVTGIAGFFLLAWFASLNEIDGTWIVLSVSLALACLGFLPFNMPRARVFMGDVGAVLLGFVYGIVVVLLAGNLTEFLALSACLFPFYADEITTMVPRIRDGESLLKPHRRHLYQLLANEMGIAHWKISLGYGLSQLVIGYTAILMIGHGFLIILLILMAFFAGFTLISFGVRKKISNSGQ